MKLQQYFDQFKAELAAAPENRENIISEQGREIIYANVPDAIALMNEIKQLLADEKSESTESTEFQEYANELLRNLVNNSILLKEWLFLKIVKLSFEDSTVVSINDIMKQIGIIAFPHDPNLIQAIEALDSLGIGSFEDSIRAFNVSEYIEAIQKLSPSAIHNNSAVKRFIQVVSEAQVRRELALKWGIGGNTVIDNAPFKLETARLTNILGKFKEEIDALKQNSSAMETLLAVAGGKELSKQDISALLAASFTSILSVNATDAKDTLFGAQIQQGVLTFSDETGTSHAIAITSWQNIFCYANRSSSTKNGIRIFAVTEEQKKLIRDGLVTDLSYDIFEATILPQLKELDFVEMKKQKAGNCTWVATKTSAWFALYVNTLKFIQEHNINVESPHELAKRIATAGYKYLSKRSRMHAIDTYLSTESSISSDPSLHAALLAKVKKEHWQARGFTRYLPMFDATTHAHAAYIAEKLPQFARMPTAEDLFIALNEANLALIKEFCSLPNAAEVFSQDNYGRTPFTHALLLLLTSDSSAVKLYLQSLELLVKAGITAQNDKQSPQELRDKLLKHSPADEQTKQTISDFIDNIPQLISNRSKHKI